jgi:acetyl-CoA C-acetyltransferase
MTIRGKAFIVGAYEHPGRSLPDKTIPQIHAEIAVGALKDAGLSLQDVDGFFSDAMGLGMGVVSMTEYLGLKLSYMDSTESGGSGTRLRPLLDAPSAHPGIGERHDVVHAELDAVH